MKIAAAYIRVSTDDQLEYSPDSQLNKIMEYAKNNDINIPKKFVFRENEGISGKKASKRPQFMRMIGTAKKKPKPFDIIIVWKFSRFARNRRDSIVYKSMLRKQCGIDVVSVTEQLSDDKMSIIVEAMIEAMDEYYSINLGEEVKRGMGEKVRRGEPVTPPAFGYFMKDKKYYINPDTSSTVKMMFSDFINGMGCRAIAEKLNSMGIRTKMGGLWENRSVEYVLRNPVYIGKIRWNPKGITGRNYNSEDIILSDGKHEPIIDFYTWKKAQNCFTVNKKMYGNITGKKLNSDFMLQGLIKCSSCGANLTKVGGYNLQCQAYSHGKCNTSHFISIKKIENMVVSAIAENLKYQEIQFNKKPKTEDSCECKVIKKQIAKEKIKLNRVKESYQNGIDTLIEYKSQKENITKRIEELQKMNIDKISNSQNTNTPKLSTLQVNIVEYLKDINISSKNKNMLLRTFIDKIIYNKSQNKIEIFYYI